MLLIILSESLHDAFLRRISLEFSPVRTACTLLSQYKYAKLNSFILIFFILFNWIVICRTASRTGVAALNFRACYVSTTFLAARSLSNLIEQFSPLELFVTR